MTKALTDKYYTPMRLIAIEVSVDRDEAYYMVSRWLHVMCKLTGANYFHWITFYRRYVGIDSWIDKIDCVGKNNTSQTP